jgi:hypothetical protein
MRYPWQKLDKLKPQIAPHDARSALNAPNASKYT